MGVLPRAGLKKKYKKLKKRVKKIIKATSSFLFFKNEKIFVTIIFIQILYSIKAEREAPCLRRGALKRRHHRSVVTDTKMQFNVGGGIGLLEE